MHSCCVNECVAVDVGARFRGVCCLLSLASFGQSSAAEDMALFVASSCGIVGDTIINRVAWSHVDQLAAMSASIVDDQDRESNQIIFTNNEVCLPLPTPNQFPLLFPNQPIILLYPICCFVVVIKGRAIGKVGDHT